MPFHNHNKNVISLKHYGYPLATAILLIMLAIVGYFGVASTLHPDARLGAPTIQHSAISTRNDALVLSPGFSELQPQSALSVLRDPSGSLSLQEIVNRKDTLFQPNQQTVFNAGYDLAQYWFRLELAATETQHLFLDLAFPKLQEVDLFVMSGERLLQAYETGLSRPVQQRPSNHNHFVFPLTIEPGQSLSLYFRVASDGPVLFPLTLREPGNFIQADQARNNLFSLYFGIVFALALFNCILFITIRDRTYFYYTLHLLLVGWFQLATQGFTPLVIWNDPASAVGQREPAIISALTLAVALLFTRNFLNLRKVSKPLNTLLSGTAIACTLVMFAALLAPTSWAVPFLLFLLPWTTAALLSSAVVSYLRGVRAARFFMIGWSILITGALVQTAMYMNWLPYSTLASQAILYASAFEAILMSLALADRINIMRLEKNACRKQALLAAEQSNQLKDQFLSTISHELRTPMNGVIGALDLVSRERMAESDHQALQVAKESSQRMLTLIDSLLRFSEIQTDSIVIDKQTFQLPKAIADLVQHLEQECHSKHIDCQINLDMDPTATYLGDLDKLRVILFQLTENALKFTHHGTIQLTMQIATPRCHTNRVPQLLMTIRDTGIGIPSEAVGTIFDAFHQVDARFNREHGGLGLGLAMIKKLVELMDGEIKVSTREGVGTQFDICLPLETFQQTQNVTPQASITFLNPQNEPFALIAEDNATNQKIIAALLAKLGYKSIAACNGEAAIIIARQVKPAIIFMDCQMPIKDGFDATREIRMLNEHMHRVPIVAVTANATSKDRQRCFEAGMNDYLTKPVTLKALDDCLHRWLPSHNAKSKGNGTHSKDRSSLA